MAPSTEEAPIKRGRGRPRKPESERKTPVKPATPSGRGRGRPKGSTNKPKTDAGVTKTIAKPTGTGRPRGRPRKVDPSGTTTTTTQTTPKKTGTGRPRGRPRKSDASAAAAAPGATQDGVDSGSAKDRDQHEEMQDSKGESDDELKESDAENAPENTAQYHTPMQQAHNESRHWIPTSISRIFS